MLNSINSVGASALRSHSVLQMSMHMQSALETRTSVSLSLLSYALIDIGARINNSLPLHRDSQIGSPSDSSRLARRVVFELARVNLENIWLATFQHRPWAFTLANYFLGRSYGSIQPSRDSCSRGREQRGGR